MISVIIPTYKSPETLEICIHSAIYNAWHDNEIIVVVDGFYDLNKEVLQKYKGKISVLDLETNHGLCRATNFGVYNASHDKILIVNDDNVFPPNWDIHLLDVYKDNRVVTPNQIEPKPSIFDEFVIKSFGTPSEFDWDGFSELADDLSQPGVITKKGSTLPIFMSKENYLTVGGWDEAYPGAWVVDWEFFHKCDLAGFELVRTHNCHFYHFVSVGTEATQEERENKLRLEGECHDYFNYKWGWYPAKNREDYKLCKR